MKIWWTTPNSTMGAIRFDLIDQGLNVDYVSFFLISIDRKHDGKLKSYQDMRKYRDAILWVAKVAG